MPSTACAAQGRATASRRGAAPQRVIRSRSELEAPNKVLLFTAVARSHGDVLLMHSFSTQPTTTTPKLLGVETHCSAPVMACGTRLLLSLRTTARCKTMARTALLHT